MSTTHIGSINHLLELPMDPLLEVFSYVYPTDLRTLSRTSKMIRNCLMSKKSKHVWRDTFYNVNPPLPDTPEGMSEPAFVEMVFCEGCSKPVEAAGMGILLPPIVEAYKLLLHRIGGRICEKDIRNAFDIVFDNYRATILAFDLYRIDMQPILSTQADLRALLEECLAAEPSQTHLILGLPKNGTIVSTLIQNLKKAHQRYQLVHRENWQRQLERPSPGSNLD